MAGSYKHVTDDDGRLRDGRGINDKLDCQSGDVTECVTQMYGMIWWLAMQRARMQFITAHPTRGQIMEVINSARENCKQGLAMGMGEG